MGKLGGLLRCLFGEFYVRVAPFPSFVHFVKGVWNCTTVSIKILCVGWYLEGGINCEIYGFKSVHRGPNLCWLCGKTSWVIFIIKQTNTFKHFRANSTHFRNYCSSCNIVMMNSPYWISHSNVLYKTLFIHIQVYSLLYIVLDTF